MELTPTHFNFSIPRLAGYKTVAVNLVVTMAGIVCTLWPHLVAPSADQIGQLFDAGLQAGGAVATALGVINTLLRLQTTTPALGMSSPEARYTAQLASQLVDTRDALAEHSLASLAREGSYTDMRSWPVVDGILHAMACTLRTTGQCNCDAALPPMQADTSHEPAQLASGTRKLASAFLVPFLLLPLTFSAVAVTLGGCETVQNIDAIGAAATTEQKGFALYGDFVIAEEAAVVIMTNKHIPVSVRRAVKIADAKAKPLADRVRNLSADLATARKAYAAAQSTGSRVASVTASLAAAIADLVPALTGLQTAVSLSD